MRNKNAIIRRELGWNIATQERKVEIVSFVKKGIMKKTVPLHRRELIQVRSRSIALWCVFDLKFNQGTYQGFYY